MMRLFEKKSKKKLKEIQDQNEKIKNEKLATEILDKIYNSEIEDKRDFFVELASEIINRTRGLEESNDNAPNDPDDFLKKRMEKLNFDRSITNKEITDLSAAYEDVIRDNEWVDISNLERKINTPSIDALDKLKNSIVEFLTGRSLLARSLSVMFFSERDFFVQFEKKVEIEVESEVKHATTP